MTTRREKPLRRTIRFIAEQIAALDLPGQERAKASEWQRLMVLCSTRGRQITFTDAAYHAGLDQAYARCRAFCRELLAQYDMQPLLGHHSDVCELWTPGGERLIRAQMLTHWVGLRLAARWPQGGEVSLDNVAPDWLVSTNAYGSAYRITRVTPQRRRCYGQRWLDGAGAFEPTEREVPLPRRGDYGSAKWRQVDVVFLDLLHRHEALATATQRIRGELSPGEEIRREIG